MMKRSNPSLPKSCYAAHSCSLVCLFLKNLQGKMSPYTMKKKHHIRMTFTYTESLKGRTEGQSSLSAVLDSVPWQG